MADSTTQPHRAPKAFTIVADSSAELSRLLSEQRDHPTVRAGLDQLGAFGRRSRIGQADDLAA